MLKAGSGCERVLFNSGGSVGLEMFFRGMSQS